MAPVRFTFTDVVPAEKHAFLKWWTDYSDTDHSHLQLPGVFESRRRVVEREDDRIVIEDDGRILGRRFTTRETARVKGDERIDVEGTTRFGSYCMTLLLEDVPGRMTRVTTLFEMEPEGALRAATPIAAPLVRAGLAWDMRRHIRDFLADHRREEARRPETQGHPTLWGPRQYGR